MAQVVAHFVFTHSGAVCLKRAVREAGRDDVVVVTDHNLNFGPIFPSDQVSRSKWFGEEFGGIDRTDAARSELVWDERVSPIIERSRG